MSMKQETLHASGAETTTGNSGAKGVVGPSIGIAVDVSAVSGTSPTLDLKVEWSPDGTNFGDEDSAAETFTQITAAKTTAKRFTTKAPFYRLVWTIGGTTPSFTFHAEAVQERT